MIKPSITNDVFEARPHILNTNDLKSCGSKKILGFEKKCGEYYYCKQERACNKDGKCGPNSTHMDGSYMNRYRICNHPNDRNCIPTDACFQDGTCSAYYFR
jgi:hypothetical protein